MTQSSAIIEVSNYTATSLAAILRLRVGVEEEQLRVSGESPVLRRAAGFEVINNAADVIHGVEAQVTRKLGLLDLIFSLVNFGNRTLDSLDGVDKLVRVTQISLLDGRDDVLVDHINQGHRFHLDGTDVVAEENRLASGDFLAGEHTHLFEELDVLVVIEASNGVAAGVNTPDTTLDGFIRPFRIVTVTVEDTLVVLGQHVLRDGERLFAGFEAVGDNLERFSRDGVQNGVHEGHVLGGTGGAELEAVTTVRERRGTVTVFRRDLNGRNSFGTERKVLLLRRVVTEGTVLDGVEVVGDGRAEVGGHDSRRGFHGTEAEVVTRGRDGKAHQVTVLVNRGDDGGHDQRENFRVASDRLDLLRVHQVETVGGTDGPVVVLTRTVDTSERLFLKQRGETVLRRDFFDDLHDHQVLVNLSDGVTEHRRELVLVRGDFTVTSLERDAHLEALLLDLAHALKRRRRSGDRGHVVVAHLLATGRELTGDGTAGELKIRAAVEGVARNQEDFLFQTNVGVHGGGADVVTHRLEQTLGLLVQRRGGAVKRGLFIEGITVVRDKGSRDEDGVFAKEDRRVRVDGEVTARRVGGAHATVRVGGTVSLTLEQLLTAEGVVRGTILGKVKHGLVDLARVTVTNARGAHRLEPVAVHRGTVIDSPVEDSLGDNVSLGHVLGPGRVFEQSRGFTILAEVLVGDGALEAARAEPFRRRRARAHGEHRVRLGDARALNDASRGLLRVTAKGRRVRPEESLLRQGGLRKA